jgi:hypothetical protein
MVKLFSAGVSFSHSFLAFQGSLGKRGNIPSGETAKEGASNGQGIAFPRCDCTRIGAVVLRL